MKIDIIIITYNRPNHTLTLLDNINELLNKNMFLNKVVLVNNNSSISYELVEEKLNQYEYEIDYVKSPENLGVARGRNFAIKRCLSNIIVTIDDDAEFKNQDALKIIVDIFNESLNLKTKIGALCFKVYYKSSGNLQRTAFPHKKFNKFKNKPFFYTQTFIGCGHAILKEVYDETGLYPTDFFYGMEEYDLSYRIISKGYSIAYTNKVEVLHDEFEGGRITSLEKNESLWFNKTKVAYRYLPYQYFISTAIMWSLMFLKQSKFNFLRYFKVWKKIFQIPKTENRDNVIGKDALRYIKSVEGRLWY